MSRPIRTALATALSLALGALLPGFASADVRALHVQRNPSVHASLRLSFHGAALPQGGYYYGVIVLRPYKRYTAKAPPPCATSSNMQRTDYGYRRADGTVRLTLTRTPSRAGQWCRGGTYAGAIYAVPHEPPCEAEYPCRAEPYERSPCFELEGGHRVCGVVAHPPEYRYPSDVPRPLAAGARIVARFSVVFR